MAAGENDSESNPLILSKERSNLGYVDQTLFLQLYGFVE